MWRIKITIDPNSSAEHSGYLQEYDGGSGLVKNKANSSIYSTRQVGDAIQFFINQEKQANRFNVEIIGE